MIEKGSRKTAPPDTARVKVHKYNLQMESNTRMQVLKLVEIKTNAEYNKVLIFSFSNQIIC